MEISNSSKVLLAGHTGFLGGAIYECLKRNNYRNIITLTREEVDLSDNEGTLRLINERKPEVVINAAGLSGGVEFNQNNPATLALKNLLIQNSIFQAVTRVSSISRVVYIGSSCMYPRFNNKPMDESFLFSGKLEETSFAYSMAKLSGVSVAQSINNQMTDCSVMTVIPSGVYGPGDNFDPRSSHVVAALIRKFYNAKKNDLNEVVLYGDGSPVRQFIYVKDVADFIVFSLTNRQASKEIFNIGDKFGISISDLAELIKEEVKYKGQIRWDTSKPNGAPYKVLSTIKSEKLGWFPSTPFAEGLKETVQFFSSSRQV